MNESDRITEILEKYGEYAILKDSNMFNVASMDYEFPGELSLTKAKAQIEQLLSTQDRESRIDENDYHWLRQRAIEHEAKTGGVSGYFLKRKESLAQLSPTSVEEKT